MSKKTLKDEDNIPSIFSQASAEEIATNIAIKKEALDLAIKEGDRLEKELGISKFLDDFAKDICDEGQEVFDEPARIKAYKSIFELTEVDFLSIFVSYDEAHYIIPAQGYYNYEHEPFRVSGKRLGIGRKNAYKRSELEILEKFKKRFKCIMCHYSDDKALEERRQSMLSFVINYPFGECEQWNIPSGIPITLPLYVLINFVDNGGTCAKRKEFLGQKDVPKEHIEKVFNGFDGSSGQIPFCKSKEVDVVGRTNFVFFKPLSNCYSTLFNRGIAI